MEKYSDGELIERHKEITNQLLLVDTEDLKRQKKELERQVAELSRKTRDNEILEEEEISISCELERRNREKQLELERQRQDLAERRSQIRSKSQAMRVGMSRRSEPELEEATSRQDHADGEDEDDSGFQNVVFSQVRQIFSSAAFLTIFMNIPGAKKPLL